MFTRLAELSVHGANVQEGQIVLVAAEIGLEEQARATAEAAYERGAKFVDVAYFDPHLKRVRIESASPDTLDFVPQWYGERVLQHAEQNGARIVLRGVTAPHVMDGLDRSLLGKDTLPLVKESLKVIDERSTNWCYVPAPHPAWAALVHPDLPADEAYEQLWRELEHVLRLDEPDPLAAWDDRLAVLSDNAARLTERRFDAIELRGPGTELTIGLLPTATWATCEFSTGRSSVGSESASKMALRSRSTPTRTQRRCVASRRSTRVRAGSVSSPSSTARGGSARSTLSSTTPCWTRTHLATWPSATASRSSSRTGTASAPTRASVTSTS